MITRRLDELGEKLHGAAQEPVQEIGRLLLQTAVQDETEREFSVVNLGAVELEPAHEATFTSGMGQASY